MKTKEEIAKEEEKDMQKFIDALSDFMGSSPFAFEPGHVIDAMALSNGFAVVDDLIVLMNHFNDVYYVKILSFLGKGYKGEGQEGITIRILHSYVTGNYYHIYSTIENGEEIKYHVEKLTEEELKKRLESQEVKVKELGEVEK
jgi:hypothetical protein